MPNLIRTGTTFLLVGCVGLFLAAIRLVPWKDSASRFVGPICFMTTGSICIVLGLVDRKEKNKLK
jgi:multisubunit Na+/H+ antiporter MnhG subunit